MRSPHITTRENPTLHQRPSTAKNKWNFLKRKKKILQKNSVVWKTQFMPSPQMNQSREKRKIRQKKLEPAQRMKRQKGLLSSQYYYTPAEMRTPAAKKVQRENCLQLRPLHPTIPLLSRYVNDIFKQRRSQKTLPHPCVSKYRKWFFTIREDAEDKLMIKHSGN